MIEKKISYDINIEKPSKTKPVKQGGVFNYLGKQKTVNAPRRWRSSPKHPIAHLAYITKDEEKILVDLDLYNSLKGRPNKGPSGIMSLNGGGGGGDGGGDGGSSGGDSGGSDSGPGGSDDGSSSGVGSGEGESTGDANDQGGTEGPGGMGPGAEGGFGIGPGDDGPGMGVSDTFGSDTAPGVGLGVSDTFGQDVAEDTAVADVDMSMPALQTFQEKAMANLMAQLTPASLTGRAIGMAVAGKVGGVIGGLIGADIGRGVVSPGYESFDQDYGQNVQTSPSSTPDGSGGITTLPQYAPLYNQSTGDNTADAMKLRLENLLKPSGGNGYQSNSNYQNFLQSPFYDPKVAGSQVITPVTLPSGQILNLPNAATANQFRQYLSSLSSLPNQSVNQLSNYSLQDLYNLRRI